VTFFRDKNLDPTVDEVRNFTQRGKNENQITYVVIYLRSVESHVQTVTPDFVEFRVR